MSPNSTFSSRLKFCLPAFIMPACAILVSVMVLPCASFAASPANLKIVSGAEQRTTYSAAFPKPLEVQVTDPVSKRGVAGIHVQFIPAAGIELSATTAVTDQFGLASVTATALKIGSSSVDASIEAASGNHGTTHVTFDSLRVGKAILTVVPANLNSTVGVVPALTEYTLSGFVNGDTVATAQVTGAPLLTTVATGRSHDANYAIKGWPGSLASPNYTFVAGFGTLALSGTRADASEPEYDPSAAPSASNGGDSNSIHSALLPGASSASHRAVGPVGSVRSVAQLHKAVQVNTPSSVSNQPGDPISIRTAAVKLPTPTPGDHATLSAPVRATILASAQPEITSQTSQKSLVLSTGLKAPGSM